MPTFCAISTPLWPLARRRTNGDGTLTVRAMGAFKVATYVRIGNLILGPTQGVVAGTGAPTSSTGSAAPVNAGASPGAPSPAPSGNATGGATPAAQANHNANSGAAAPSGSTPQNQTTLQIQGTVQIVAAQPSQAPQSPGAAAPAKITPNINSFYTTANYIMFTASASAIALQGARLVDHDGNEEDILRKKVWSPLPTCAARLAEYMAPPSINSANTANGTVGIDFSYQITALNSPTS